MSSKFTLLLFITSLVLFNPYRLLAASQPSAATMQLSLVGEDGKPMPYAVAKVLGATERYSDSSGFQADVDQIGRRFSPFMTILAPGGQVTFPNRDDTRHSVYSFSGENSFEIQLFRANDAPPVQMAAEGIVKLGCNIHDSMKGYVYVTDNASARISDEQGLVEIQSAALHTGAIIAVWHPLLKSPFQFQVTEKDLASQQPRTVNIAAIWLDPQGGKSVKKLEQLLRRFADDSE